MQNMSSLFLDIRHICNSSRIKKRHRYIILGKPRAIRLLAMLFSAQHSEETYGYGVTENVGIYIFNTTTLKFFLFQLNMTLQLNELRFLSILIITEFKDKNNHMSIHQYIASINKHYRIITP